MGISALIDASRAVEITTMSDVKLLSVDPDAKALFPTAAQNKHSRILSPFVFCQTRRTKKYDIDKYTASFADIFGS